MKIHENTFLDKKYIFSGKLWGSSAKQPILALHGWSDNAGSFDHVIPLLKNSSILAIDLPGHGLSSWLPRGIPYDNKAYIQTVRLIAKHYSWDKVKFLGHSLGGIICFDYARIFPEETEFIISIDSIGSIPQNASQRTIVLANSIEKFINLEKKITLNPPSYSKEEIIKRWSDSSVSELDIHSIKTLLKR